MTQFCYTCGGKGLDGGCPECGKSIVEKTKIFYSPVSNETIKYGAIPEQYANKNWNRDALLKARGLVIDTQGVKRYIEQLEKIISIFERGEIPKQSAVIVADRGWGKRIFAYQCMKFAAEHGYKIAPILDHTEINYISLKSATSPDSKYLFNTIPVENLLFADILFITVDIANYKQALTVIESFMDKRARFGKPTFILSRMSLPQLAQYGHTDHTSWMDHTRNVDNLRYPVVINGKELQ